MPTPSVFPVQLPEAVLTRIQLCELLLPEAVLTRQTWTSEAEEALSILQIKGEQAKVVMI